MPKWVLLGSGNAEIPGVECQVTNIKNPDEPGKALFIFSMPEMAAGRMPEAPTKLFLPAYGWTINFCACMKFVPSIWTK
jgi:hypothetical protein